MHEVAQWVNPKARVVYVDRDPFVVEQSEKLLRGNPNTAFVNRDIRDAAGILGSDAVHDLIDLSRPVAILCVAVLQFVPGDGEPGAILRSFRDAVAPGRHLALSHPVPRSSEAAQISQTYAQTRSQLTFRTPEQVRELFDGWEILEPGVVSLHQWRPSTVEPGAQRPGSAAAENAGFNSVQAKPCSCAAEPGAQRPGSAAAENAGDWFCCAIGRKP